MKKIFILMIGFLYTLSVNADMDSYMQQRRLEEEQQKQKEQESIEAALTAYTKRIMNENDNVESLTKRAIDDLVFVEGGRYQMGDVTGDWDVYSNSKPAHFVNVDSFWISKHKVTLNDYLAYLSWNEKVKHYPIQDNEDTDPRNKIRSKPIQSYSYWLDYQEWQQQHPDEILPVYAYWNEANFYCQWLAEQTGLPFDLPTEAQWEYAARNRGQMVKYATDTGELDKGRNVPTDQEFRSYTAIGYHPEFGYLPSRKAQYQPLGLYPATPLGLYDMTYSGWEWMKDYYSERYYQHSPEDNPQGAEPFIWRSLRGMDWRGTENRVWRGGYLGTTITRNRELIRFWAFPHAYTVRCVVNSPKSVLQN